MGETYQFVYGGFILCFTAIAYLFIKMNELNKSANDAKAALPIINAKLDELNNTLRMFLKQEIEVLKDIAKSNKERNEREAKDE
jgi:hypothetical protein